MINHISIAVNDPEKVASVLAEIWDGMAFPFPPAPGSFFVLANDGKGSAVEVTPAGTVLVPGEGFPTDAESVVTTEEFGARFVKSELVPRYVATHLNINTKKSVEEIREIAMREGWRVLVCDRDGLFELIEIWVENTFMLEVMTPEQTARYVEITDPAFVAAFFAENMMSQPSAATVVENLSVIG